MKDFAIGSENDQTASSVVFRVEELALREVADYFRDLSLNYHDYINGYAQWPTRPDGLQVVRDLFEEENAA